MRGWERKTRKELERTLRPALTEVFKKEYAANHVSEPIYTKPNFEQKLTEEHKAIVDEQIVPKI